VSERPAPHVWQAAVAASWAILPEKLPVIFEIAARENLDIEAVAARLGRPLDNTRAVTLRPDGVAIIPIEGVIFPRASLFAAISGGVSADELATDLATALDDPGVSGILLSVDSPGGDVNGVAEVAAMIRAGTARKPIVAYVRDLGASAAYWLASAADEVTVASTALVGSIGIIGTVADPSKQSARSIEFVSSQSPHKRPDPTTQAGGARIQARVDDLAAIFIGDVARYRGVTPETVAADFGQGDVLVGQAAVDAGLADRVGSFEDEVRRLQARAREPRRDGISGRMAAQTAGGSMAEQTRMQRFMAWLGGEGDDSAFAAANIAASGDLGHAVADSETREATRVESGTRPTQPDPEVARLRAELAQLRDEQRTRAEAEMAARATAFADGLIRDGRALPVEREALIAAHTEAATDDLAHPRAEGQPSRVARLEERQAARPASGMLGELVPVQPNADGTLTPLANLDRTAFVADADADAPLTLERRIQIMAMTDLGRAELRRQGIPIPAAPAQS
jgi:capsid assembly protease